MISGPGGSSDNSVVKLPKDVISSKSKMKTKGGREHRVDVLASPKLPIEKLLEITAAEKEEEGIESRRTSKKIRVDSHFEAYDESVKLEPLLTLAQTTKSVAEERISGTIAFEHIVDTRQLIGAEIEKNIIKIGSSSELMWDYTLSRGPFFPPVGVSSDLDPAGGNLGDIRPSQKDAIKGENFSDVGNDKIVELAPKSREFLFQKEGICVKVAEDDSKLLALIARLRRSLGSDFKAEEIKCAIDLHGSAEAALEALGGLGSFKNPLFMSELDLKYYISFICEYPESEIAPNFAELIHDISRVEQERRSKESIDSLINDVATFSGISGKISIEGRLVSLEGSYRMLAERAMSEVLSKDGEETFDFLDEAERMQMREALEIAADYRVDKTVVDRIKQGRVTILNSGYGARPIGHAINIVFWGHYFSICNRGSRITAETIKMYEYDPSKINESVIKFIVNPSFLVFESIQQGIRAQEINIYIALPLMLNARLVPGKVDSPFFSHFNQPKKQVMQTKNQKSGNCVKSSSLTAFAMAIFMKNYDELVLEPNRLEKAATIAKLIKSAMSFRMRLLAINKLKNYLLSHPENNTLEVQIVLNTSQRKLGKSLLFRYLSYSKIKMIEDRIKSYSDERSIPPTLCHPRDLLIIAKRREDEKNFNLGVIPFNEEFCAYMLKFYNLQDLVVSPRELALVSEVNKALSTINKF
jgi:hypothetical protein